VSVSIVSADRSVTGIHGSLRGLKQAYPEDDGLAFVDDDEGENDDYAGAVDDDYYFDDDELSLIFDDDDGYDDDDFDVTFPSYTSDYYFESNSSKTLAAPAAICVLVLVALLF